MLMEPPDFQPAARRYSRRPSGLEHRSTFSKITNCYSKARPALLAADPEEVVALATVHIRVIFALSLQTSQAGNISACSQRASDKLSTFVIRLGRARGNSGGAADICAIPITIRKRLSAVTALNRSIARALSCLIGSMAGQRV
jgi:hypothetical protein